MNRRDVLKGMAYGATTGAFELFKHTYTAAELPAVSTAEAQPNIILNPSQTRAKDWREELYL